MSRLPSPEAGAVVDIRPGFDARPAFRSPFRRTARAVAFLLCAGLAAAQSTTVVISEFRTRGPAGTSDEFVEIYNKSCGPVSIAGWKLKGSSSGGTVTTRATVPAGVTLAAGQRYLFGRSGSGGYTGATDQTYSTSYADGGGIAITNAADVVIDQVGMSSGSAYGEGARLAPMSANVNQSYERGPGGSSGNATDVNENASDFFLNASTSNPQTTAAAANLVTVSAPTVCTASPDTFCAGSTPTITLVGGGGSGVVMEWFAGACGTNPVGTGSPLSIPAPAATTTYYVRWNSTCAGTSACGTVTVTVSSGGPTAPTSATASSTQLCGSPSGNITLTALGGSGATLNWADRCLGSPIATGTTVSVPAPQWTTTYFAWWSVPGCGDSACVSVTVYVDPLPSMPTSPVASPSTVCSGASSSISVRVNGGEVVDWYSGSCGGTFVGTGNPLSVTPSVTTTYYAQARDAVTGCVSSRCAQVTVTVGGTAPTAPTSASASTTSFCGTPSGTITLTAVGGSGTTLRWYTGSCGGTFLGNGTPLTVNAPSSTTTYYARWTTTSCGNSACASVTVTVNPNPSTPTGPSATPSTICSGASSSLQVRVNSGEVVDWYSGSCGGTLVGTGNPLTVSPTVTTTYYARARKTATGCVSANCASTTVTVNPSPVAPTSASSSVQTFCGTPTGNITLTAVGGSGTTLKWYTGSCGGTFVGSGASLTIPAPAATTTYYALWNTSTCGNSACASTTVTVNPLPATPTNAAASPSTVCAGAPATLTAVSGAGTTIDWFSGSCGGTAVGTGSSISVSPTATATYYARARNTTTGCVSANCATVVVTVEAAPVAPTSASSSAPNLCGTPTGNVTLTAVGGSGATLKWFTGSCGGTQIGVGSPLTIAAPTATTTYYAAWSTPLCGLSACASTTVTVAPDTAPPVLSGCPSAAGGTFQCAATLPEPPTVTANDACSGPVAVVYAQTVSPPGPNCSGTVTRTWTATDPAGNSASCTQTFQLLDTTPPTLNGLPANVGPGVPNLAAFANALPATATLSVVNPAPGAATYFQSTITNGGMLNGTFGGWCVDTDNTIGNNTAYFVNVYSSYETLPASVLTATGIEHPENLDLVNWIVNQSFVGQPAAAPCAGNYTYGDVQRAIWSLIDDTNSTSGLGTWDSCRANQIAAAAQSAGEGFVPTQCGQFVAVILQPVNANGVTSNQITIAQVTVAQIQPNCGTTYVECDAVPAAPTVTATDNCATNVAVQFSETIVPGAAVGQCTIVRTWTATDGCNTATESRTIEVSDTTPPTISGVGPPMTLPCGSTPAFSNPTASDLCDPSPTLTFEDVTTPGACAGSYVVTRTWTATDECGNEMNASQSATIVDMTPPTLTAPTGSTIFCGETPAFGEPTAVDACGSAVTIVQVGLDAVVPSTTAGCGSYDLVRTWVATDACGNASAPASTTIHVIDNVAPVLTVPAPATIGCGTVPVFAAPTAVDACGSTVTISQVGSDLTTTSSIAGCNSYAITRTWVATDACGNASAPMSSTINVVDNVAPVLTVPADSSIKLPATPNFGAPTAVDACGSTVTIAQVGADVVVPSALVGCNSYEVTRTWIATDACGNASAPQSTTITVVDDAAPVLTVPAGSVIAMPGTPVFGTPTAVDAAGSATTVTQVGSDVVTPSNLPGCNSYDVTRTWIATDACGNASAPQSTTISVVDDAAPVLTVPAPATINCGETPVFGTPTAVDGAGSAVTVTQVGSDVTTPSTTAGCNGYVITRTWVATDACGNASAPLSTTITVVDNVAPVLTVPAPSTINCGESPVFGEPTAVDACGSTVTISQVGSDVTTPSTTAGCNGYSITRTWVATDACGNASAPLSTTITVVDNVAPVLTVPAPSTINCGESPVFGEPTAVDACGSTVTIAQVGSDVTTPSTTAGCNSYSITRTWVATDACGNASAPLSTTITVVDNVAPVLTVPAPSTINCGESPVFSEPTAVDACGSTVTIAQVGSDVTTPSTTAGCNAYSITRTWVATDACGNASAPLSTTITVVDNVAPVLTVPAPSTINCGESPVFGEPTAVDACGSTVTIAQVGSDVTTPSTTAGCNSYSITRTWVATDACGNASAPMSSTINVVDNVAPVLTVPTPSTINCGETPVFSEPTAVDACGSTVTIAQVGSDVTTPSTTAGCNAYSITRTWVATDACGNASAPMSSTITVVDNVAPVLTVPAPSTINCGESPVFGEPTAVDACGSTVTIAQVGSDVTTPSTTAGCNSYSITRTWVATDACGNASAPLSTTITVVDNVAPVLTVPAPSTINCGESPVFGEPTAVDACGSTVTIAQVGSDVTTPSTTAGCNAYSITRTWVATDACGNASAPMSSTITVVDNVAPVLTVPAPSTINCGESPVFGEPTAVDACGSTVTIAQVGSDVTTPSTTAGCNAYSITRTWVATDACGNASAPMSSTITVVDNVAPVLTVPAPSTINCGESPVFGEPTAVDACGSTVTIAQVGSDVTTPSTTAGCNAYSITRTWVATDACGNASAPMSSTITVVDNVAPVLTVPAPSTINCGESPVFGEPTAVDACGSTVTIAQVGSDVTTPSTTAGCNAYSITRTWVATDACGNASAPMSSTINVVDNVAPVLTVPADSSIKLPATPNFGAPTAVDACGSTVTITQVGADVVVPSALVGCNSYEVTRTWIATDACGNASAPQSTTITVVDDAAPVLTVPAGSVIAMPGTPVFGTPTAVDAAGSTTTVTQVGSDVVTPSNLPGCNSYDVTRTWIATDACGNASAPQSTTISVVDDAAPILTVPAPATINCGEAPVFGTPTAVDGAGSAVTVTQVGSDVTTPSTTAGCNGYMITRTWVATDACGNASAPMSSTITVVDNVAPVLTVPAPSTINCGETPVFGEPTAVDACGSTVTISQVGSDATTPSTTAGCNGYSITRTWVATDACGNASAPLSTTITVVDNVAPVLTVPAPSTINCGESPVFGEPTAVDACGSTVTISQVGSDVTTPSTTAGCNSYSITRTWVATDACGNASAPLSTTITVVDNVAPVLTVPAPSTINCGESPVFGEPTATDACGSTVTVAQVGSDVTTPSTTAGCNAYSITRTWVATDACGNASAPMSSTITVVDNVAPVLTVPAPSTINCGESPVFGEPTAVDACGSTVTIAQVGSDVTTPSTTAGCNAYSITRTWVATDACGNASAPLSTTITVVDNVAPVLTVPAPSTINCGETPVFGEPTAVDACGSTVTIAQVGSDVTTPSTTAGCNAYSITRTWVATDACGNASAPMSTTITVVDNVAPVLTVPAPSTINCGESPVFGEPTATDACGSTVTIAQVGSDVTTPSTTAGCNAYSITRTWVATDACGNASAPLSTTITVIDNVAPVLTVPAPSMINCGETPVFSEPTAVDACGSTVTISQVGSDVTTPSTTAGCNSYSITRTWVATDACGNASAPLSTTITVVDNVAPVLTVPAPSTINCGESPVFGEPTATDACGSTVTIAQVGSDVTTPSTTAGCNAYSITRTWVATDACGNASAPLSTTITVVDNVAPVLTVPAPSTINCGETPVFGEPTAVDACGSTVTIAQVGSDVTTPSTTAGCNAYSITRTWVATDACGNASAPMSTTITVVDNVAPVLTVPAPSTINCGESPVFGEPTAVDACGSTVTISQVGSDVTTPSTTAGCNSYSITRTWVATDACGNASAPMSSTITVVDNVAPVLTVPAPSTINCGESPVFGEPTAVDACGSTVTIAQVGSDVTTPSTTAGCNSYSITRTWVATDACGNASAPLSSTITVVDNVAPVLTVPADSSIKLPATPNFGAPTAVDACGSTVTITQVGADVVVPSALVGCNSYEVTRTWIATDACGNASAPQSTTITVVDDAAPVLTVPAGSVIAMPGTPVFGTPTAVDAAGSTTTVTQVGSDVVTPSNLPGCNSYDVTRTWIATDACGNASAPQSTTISVVDDAAPVLTVPAPATINCGETPVFGEATAVDAAGSAVTVTQVGSDVTTPSTTAGCNGYMITRTWVATDACGNASAPMSSTITVVDNVAPVLTVPAPSTINCGETPVFGDPTAVDACGSTVTIAQVGSDVTTPSTTAGCNGYSITRTWVATDACGNASAPLSTTITVVDNVAPVLTVPAPSTINCGESPVFGEPTATDACGSTVTIAQVGSDVTTPSTTAGCNAYSITRTWVATDACGNASAPMSSTITVVDNVAPVLTVPAPSTINCGESPVFGEPTAVDACGSTVTIAQVGSDVTTPSTTAGCNSYSITRTWVATDACGNASAPLSTTITVVDNVAPVLTRPADGSVECGSPIVFGEPTAVDACGSAVTISQAGADVVTPSTTPGCGAYSVTRTWIATDACGNASAPQSATVQVVDSTPPTFSFVPANLSLACGEATPPPGVATATDACSTVVVAYSGEVFSTDACRGFLTRTWTATDACGNVATATQTIDFVDTTPPTLVCFDGLAGAAGTGVAFVPNYASLSTASDNCGAVTVTQSPAPGTPVDGPPQTVQVVVTATDACGNTTTCTSTYTTSDAVSTVLDLGGGCGFPGPRLFSTYAEFGGFATLSVKDADPAGALLLFVDPEPLELPFFRQQCLVFVDPFFSFLFGPFPITPTGDWSYTTFIPDATVLIGFTFIAQAAILAPNGPLAGGAYVTNGVQVEVGPIAPFTTRTASALAGSGPAGTTFDANFATVFPSGLDVGQYQPGNGASVPNGLRWTPDAAGLAALKTFLGVASGTSGALSNDALNPASPTGAGGALAQQAATLAVNVAFSAAGLAGPVTGFGGAVYLNPGSGDPLHGFNATELLLVANQTLAGFSPPAGHNAASLAALLTAMNESFENGQQSFFANLFVFNPPPAN